jgi:hypothetical protein
VGAGKLPEQIVQRIEEGLRAIEEDRQRDPVMDRVMAQPIKRTVKPEEKNRRTPRLAEAQKSRLTVAKRLIIESRLRDIRDRITALRSCTATTRPKTIDEQIATLRRQARQLREMLPTKGSKRRRSKRSKKGRSPRPRVR